MRVASIDIGTNTALFVIAETGDNGELRTIFEDHEIIRLGQHVDESGMIQPAAVERCVSVIRRFREKADLFECKHLYAAGTSAIRDALNREWFLGEMFHQTGINVSVLSGEDEALCTYFGGRLTLGPAHHMKRAMVIDIGGGSTEIVTGDHQKIDFKISMNIGAVRLTERFLSKDPVDGEEEKQMRGYCRDIIGTSLSGLDNTDSIQILGVAGTITTIAAMIQRMSVYSPQKIDGFFISDKDLNDQINRLRILTIDKRKLLDGLEPKRADVIFAGAVILDELLKYFRLSGISASNYGLRYGLILRALGNH